ESAIDLADLPKTVFKRSDQGIERVVGSSVNYRRGVQFIHCDVFGVYLPVSDTILPETLDVSLDAESPEISLDRLDHCDAALLHQTGNGMVARKDRKSTRLNSSHV